MRNTIYFKWFLQSLTEEQQKDYRERSMNQQKDWYISYLENRFGAKDSNVFNTYSVTMYHSDPEFICSGSTVKKCIKMVKSKKDLVNMVKHNEGHIIIEEVTINELESESRVFDTDNDEAWETITGKERY